MRDSCELSGERGSRRGLPHEQPVAEAVTDVGVDLAGHGDAHAGEVRLGDVGFAVVGAHVPVEVEQTCRLGPRIEMRAGK